MERNWLSIGKEVVDQIGQDKILHAISNIQFSSDRKKQYSFTEGYALRGIIDNYFHQNVLSIGIGYDVAPYSLLAIEASYANGTSKTYFVEINDVVTPVVSDFFPKC